MDLNCEAYSSFECVSSNYRIVAAKKRLSLRRKTTQTIRNKYSFNIILQYKTKLQNLDK